MQGLTYGSVCSGIEAASVGWEPLGFTPLWFSEIEPFPSAVLAHHWPDVPNLGDMTQIAKRIEAGEVEVPDILVGGTPWQAFSISGLRKGLKDPRGQLTISYVEIADEIDRKRTEQNKPASIIVWENVPGVLSSKDNAFGCFLAALAGEDDELQPSGKKWSDAGLVCGPQRAIAWRVIDAQHTGLAQRRRRVFVVASARADIDPGKILFEFDGMRGDSPPSREKKETVTALTANGVGTCGADDNQAQGGHIIQTGLVGALDTQCGFEKATMQSVFSGHVIPHGYRQTAFGEYVDDNCASTCKARDYKDATDLVTVDYGSQDPCVNENLANPIARNNGLENTVCIASNIIGRADNAGGNGVGAQVELSYTLDTSTPHAVTFAPLSNRPPRVRRLTPVECERLQGFPDSFTLIPVKKIKKIQDDLFAYYLHHVPGLTYEDAKRLAEDGPRYKALGNSMATPVMRWIGVRIIDVIRGFH